MKRKQSGITLVGFIIVLAVVGMFAFFGMKVLPMYSEYFAVKKAMSGLASEAGVTGQDIAKIKELFFRRLDISYSDNVKPENLKFKRKDAGYVMTVDYEVRKPLIYNLDIVGKFHAEQELRRTPGE